MASEAEVELVISTANALPQLERDLSQIIQRAENDADDLELQALLDSEASLRRVLNAVDDLVDEATAAGEDIVLEARLDQREAISTAIDDIQDLVRTVEAAAPAIDLEAQLDADIAELDAEIEALVAELEAAAPDVEIEVNVDRDGRGAGAFNNLGKAAKSALPSIGKFTGALLAAGPAAAGAAGLLAGVATAVEQIAPAAAVAVPALISLQLVTQTLKVGMLGVGDAVKAAFDPEGKPEELEKALKRLAPEARAFVVELQGMKKQLTGIQQTVQNNLFKGFAGALKELSTTVLPAVSTATQNTSKSLNAMALGAAGAASQLGKEGTLGRALSGATDGLRNLEKVPAQVVTALGQLGAAAAPAFDRLTSGAAKAATAISKKLSDAFKSGALEDAIDGAIDAIAQLGRVAGNVFEGLGNIFSTLSQSGGGLFSVLEKITQAFADVTATKGFQDALKALSSVMSTIVATVLPLLSQALQVLGPVFQALGPPIELLVKALGDALQPIIAALGPVLVELGLAFGRLVGVVTPFLALIGELVAAALPILTPLLDAVGQALNGMIPFAKQIADLLAAAIVPLFNRLATEVLPQVLPPLVELSQKLLPVLGEILAELSPSLISLAMAFGDVAMALVPLIVALAETASEMLDQLMPILQPLIDLLIKLAKGALATLVFQLLNIVVPAIQVLVDLLNGDFHAAWEGVKKIVQNVTDKVSSLIGSMRDRLVDAFNQMMRAATDKINETANRVRDGFNRMVQAANDKVNELVNRIRDGFQRGVDSAREKISQIPDIVRAQLGNAGSILFNAGREIVQGLIDGLVSRLSRLRDIASQIADTVKNAIHWNLGIHSPSRVMMETGENTIKGFELGILKAIPSLRRELQGVASLAPSFALPNGGTLQLPSFSPGAPNVQVFLGNELINEHIDSRVTQANRARDRVGLQGVRR